MFCCVGLVGVLCSAQAEGKGDAYFSMVQKAFEDKDYQQALAYYQKTANIGSAKAYDGLGVMYEMGTGVRKNYQKS
ncbi:hypothetical protein HSHS1_05660 [Helicobacter suis HS1]|uniref:sel1 repeat family protein n=2 Tax=Helicobacter suis TaxID=104628 RepID=UPI0002EC6BF6|nr:sel1 repeat family protein [Helicobacter suis]BDR27805.1 hypothetical protein HSHS1_05660 [Helicobacter suis HS1]